MKPVTVFERKTKRKERERKRETRFSSSIVKQQSGVHLFLSPKRKKNLKRKTV